MPYITQGQRNAIEAGIGPESPGELNYVLTVTIDKYVKENGMSYQSINDVLGALEGAKLEFYRRVAVPYENGKLSTNGDIYGS